MKRSIQLPFCGFYESEASRMIDDEIEQAFADENGTVLNIPQEIYYKKDYTIDYYSIKIEFVKAYIEAFADRFEGETGINLHASFEEMTSPKEYNFKTDRVFALVPDEVITQLFIESEKDKHEHLAEVIKDRCTSYDGFYSYYSNQLSAWLEKPLASWDHNELELLLIAVAAIHCDTSDWHVWDLMESWMCNGGLSNAVWEAMPAVTHDFADTQRYYGKAVDFGLWLETGKAYAEGTDLDALEEGDKLPPPRCDKTLEMKF